MFCIPFIRNVNFIRRKSEKTLTRKQLEKKKNNYTGKNEEMDSKGTSSFLNKQHLSESRASSPFYLNKTVALGAITRAGLQVPFFSA